MCFSPAWWTTSGRSGSGSCAMAAGTRSFNPLAPRLPPTISRRIGPLRPAKRSAGGGSVHTESRSGLPTHSTRRAWAPFNACGKPSRIRSAPYASTRVASPATAFASCSTSALPAAAPMRPPGNDANPPKPRTTSGFLRPMILRASRHAASSANGPSSSVRSPLPRTPRNATPSKSTPCCGTSFASMPSRVPSQNTLAPSATSFAATASPGNTCPPVPPVVIMMVNDPHACG